MITKEQLIVWLEKKSFRKVEDTIWENGTTRYEVFTDHFRKLLRDKPGQWHCLEVTTFVDLFLQSDGEILNKWHHVIGKNLSPYFQ